MVVAGAREGVGRRRGTGPAGEGLTLHQRGH